MLLVAFLFLGHGFSHHILYSVTAAMQLRDACSLEEKLWQHRQHNKIRDITTDKGPASQSCGFSSSHLWMCELDRKEGWALRNLCFLTVVLEKTLESVLDCKEIKPVNPKGNQPWILTGRTDAEAEASLLRPLYTKNWLIGKDLGAGKDRRQEEKGTTEDEMVGWYHRLNGHEFELSSGSWWFTGKPGML